MAETTNPGASTPVMIPVCLTSTQPIRYESKIQPLSTTKWIYISSLQYPGSLATFSLFYLPSPEEVSEIQTLAQSDQVPVCIGHSDANGNFFFYGGDTLNEVGSQLTQISRSGSIITKSHDIPAGILPHRLRGQLLIQLHPHFTTTHDINSVAELTINGWNVFQVHAGCGAWRYVT